MSWKATGVGIVILCVILAGAIILAGIGGPSQVTGDRQEMMMDSDRMFIEGMIPHHQDAVDMGELALVKAEHPEIRQLGENVIRDQSREISLMRGWYREWYGIDVPAISGAGGMGMMGGGSGMMGGMDGNMTDLLILGNATSFDKEFIEQMIPHHQTAIMMARMVTENAEHEEIRSLGSSIIRSQSAEVDMMQGWYRTWYGSEVPVKSPTGK